MAGDDSGAGLEAEFDTWFLGDQLAWSKYLPRAWRIVTGAPTEQAFPSWINHNEPPRWPAKAFGIFEAYLHLLHFRLGWTAVGHGLLEWDRLGRPQDDPVLAFMSRLGGDGLDWFISWAAGHEGLNVSADLSGPFDMGGSDELHLSLHSYAPGVISQAPMWEQTMQLPSAYRLTPGSLTSDDYVGWWNVLALAPDHCWTDSIDVTATPIGWLGTYRRSPSTGIPHATTEDVHALGIDRACSAEYESRLRELRERHGENLRVMTSPGERPVSIGPMDHGPGDPLLPLPPGVGVLEQLPAGEPVWAFTEATAYRSHDGADATEVCVEMIGEEARFFQVAESRASADGFPILIDEELGTEFRVRSLREDDGRWLSRFAMDFPVDLLETLILAKDEYALTHDDPFDAALSNPIEVMEILISADDEQAFALHYLQAVDFEVKDHYWLANDGWTDEFPNQDPRWLTEVDLQTEELELTLDEDGDADEFEVWSNATTIHVEPWSVPALVNRWSAGRRIDRVMAELAEHGENDLLCIEDLSPEAQQVFFDEIESNPFVHAEPDPASKDLLALGPENRMAATWVLKIYEYLHDANRS